MATVSGRFLLKRTLSTSFTSQTVNFTSNLTPYTRISINDVGALTALEYYNSSTEVDTYAFTWSNPVTGAGNWNNTVYQVIDFGSTSQTVSSTFNTWLTTNGIPIAAHTYNLKVDDVPTTQFDNKTVRFIIKNNVAYQIVAWPVPLAAPSVSVSDDIVTLIDNDGNATGFKVYFDNTYEETITK